MRNASGRLVYAPPGTPDADRLRELAARAARAGRSRCEPSGNLVVDHDAVRLRERARAARSTSPATRTCRHDRRREHDLRRRARGRLPAPTLARRAPRPHLLEGAASMSTHRRRSPTRAGSTRAARSRGCGRTTASTRSSPCSSTSARSSTSRTSLARGKAAGAADVLLARPQGGVRRATRSRRALEDERALRGPLSARLRAVAPGDRRGGRRARARSSAPRRSCTAAPARATTSCASSSRSRRTTPASSVIAPLRDHDLDARGGDRVRARRAASRSRRPRRRRTRSTRTCSAARSRPAMLEDPWDAPPEEPYALTSEPRRRAARRSRS